MLPDRERGKAVMRVSRFYPLVVFPLCISLAAAVHGQGNASATAKSTPPPAPAPPNPTATYPQIVRISYLEGDVRVARWQETRDQGGATWEKAVAGLPLETGYSVATGAGRAEIEFEDASTVYLAENSILSFSDLHTTGGIPHTEMSMMAGTATLHLKPVSGESFVVRTFTDGLTIAYPNKAYLRVTGYSDAIAIASQKDESFQLDAPGSAMQNALKGQTEYFRNGASIAAPAAGATEDLTAWDAWVANRVSQRAAAMKATMKAANLDTPLPGLAELNGRGTFFPCAPYGTCWDPPSDPDQQQTTGIAQAAPQGPGVSPAPDFSLSFDTPTVSVHPGVRFTANLSVTAQDGFAGAVNFSASLPNGFLCVSCSGQIAPGQSFPMELMADLTVRDGTYQIPFTAADAPLTHQAMLTVIVYRNAAPVFAPAAPAMTAPAPAIEAGFIFPCYPAGVLRLTPGDIRIGRGTYLVPLSDPPYGWTVCHAGTWIYRRNHYVWVVGRRIHHHPPIHWVKSKKTVGYVPRHPRDEKGKPPINCKHEVYGLRDKKGDTIERTHFDPNAKIETLNEAPKELRNPQRTPLERADAPPVAVHSMAASKIETVVASDPLDHPSQNAANAKVTAAGTGRSTRFAPQGGSAPTSGHAPGLHMGSHNNVIPKGNKSTHTGAQPAHTTGGHSGAGHAGGGHSAGGHTGGGHSGGGHTGGGHSGGGGHGGGGHH